MKFFVMFYLGLVIEETVSFLPHLLASSLLLEIHLVVRQSFFVVDTHAGTLIARHRIFVVNIEGRQSLRIKGIGLVCLYILL